MTNDIKQLADITADWCDFDLQPQRVGRLENADEVAEEAIRCLLYTIGQSEDARRLLLNLVSEESIRVHMTRQETE
jgi:hypothetical protein